MIPRKSYYLVVLFLLCISIRFHVGKSDEPLVWTCPSDAVYNVNTTNGKAYRNNIESLLSVLTSIATHSNGFYNYTDGATTGAAVYGLSLCRGDVTPRDCQACVTSASSSILENCPNGTYAVMWYWKCMVRYSNQSIFSRLDVSRGWTFSNFQSVSDPVFLNRVLNRTFDQIIIGATSGDVPGKKFAIREVKFTAFRKLYTLGQCTPDLTNRDCESCLRSAISNLPSCCNGSIGGSVMYPSCNIEYETFRWYRVQPAPPSSQLPSNNASSPNDSVQVPASNSSDRGTSTKTSLAIVVPTIIVSIAAFGLAIFFLVKMARRRKTQEEIKEIPGVHDIPAEVESLRYRFNEVEACTNNFSDQNIITHAAFGPVYKGILPNGQIVVVKRLSKSSRKGGMEFINEIALVAKFHHKNLVRLLGYCLEREEKILIYEFIANKSLDHFLFDLNKQAILDWSKRSMIIRGIARGLLYLQENTHFKISQCSLKASNVLLDDNMNPKIANYGMGRLFEADQSEGHASTFGYMAPEYIFHGILSVKSDVFSFGVLVLEIITGKKNNNFQGFGDDDLLSHVWKQWKDGTPLLAIDQSMKYSYNDNEVIRCIHIGLLCVEEDVGRRPTISSVLLMLSSDFVSLPSPNRPAYFSQSKIERLPKEIRVLKSNQPNSQISINIESITEVYPR